MGRMIFYNWCKYKGEKMGVKFTNDSNFLTKSIEETNIAILHAPLFHPARKNVGPIRKELGVKTFFNMLGPMVNPSFPQNQMVGVFSLELAQILNASCAYSSKVSEHSSE